MTRSAKRRVVLGTYGYHGTTVNVFADVVRGREVARAEWRIPHPRKPHVRQRKTQSFYGARRDREAAAKAFGKQKALELQAPVSAVATRIEERVSSAPLVVTGPVADRATIGEIWTLFRNAHLPDWAPATLTINDGRWKVFTAFLPPDTYADTVVPETIDLWRTHLTEQPTEKTGEPMARNQIAHCVALVKRVWTLAFARKRLRENPLATYAVRRGRNAKATEIPAFTQEHWAKILSQFDYRKHSQWRAWAAIALDGLLSPRGNALLKLKWPDIHGIAVSGDRDILWPAETDKMRKERRQPLPRDAVRVLRICMLWARQDGYAGPFVFYGAQARTRHKHWTYSALNGALVKACDQARVPRVKYQAMHGFRRLSGTDVLEQTGDVNKTAMWLGIGDLNVLKRSYLRPSRSYLTPVADGKLLPTSAKRRRHPAKAE